MRYVLCSTLAGLAALLILLPGVAAAERITITFDNGAYDPDIENPGGHQHGPYDYLESGARIAGFWAAEVGTPGAFFWQGHTHLGPTTFGGNDGNAEVQHAWTGDLNGLHISFEDGRIFDVVSVDYRIRRRLSDDPEQQALPWGYELGDTQMLLTTQFDPTQSDFQLQWTAFGIDNGLPNATTGMASVPKETPWATQAIFGFEDVSDFYLTSSASVAFDNIVLEWSACGNGAVELREQCEVGDDDACPGLCLSDCACDPFPDDVIPPSGGVITGEVSGPSHFQGRCSGGSANSPELILDWTAPQSGVISMETCSSVTDFDTVLYVRETNSEGTEVACNDDTDPCGVSTDHARAYRQGSHVEFPVTAGQLYRVFVDGWANDEPIDPGVFELSVTGLTACGDQIRDPGEACDGSDAAACPGLCQNDCTCAPVCGDSILDVGEECDGTADGACPGSCLADCTCEAVAAPTCGNALLEAGEQCDGSDDGACPGECMSDCTCLGTTYSDIGGSGDLLSDVVEGPSEYEGSCSANSSLHPDTAFDWIPSVSTIFTIETCSDGTDFDTVLYVREGAVDGPEVACNDDTVGCGVASGHSNASRQGSRVELAVQAGQLYKVFVDGWTRTQTIVPGAFDLAVIPQSQCGDGVAEASEACDGADDAACPGLCQSDCTCEAPPAPVCGDSVRDAGELCDGADDAACPGLCQSDCTCEAPPAPVCGDSVRDAGELCDGADDAACPGLCRSDCTCGAPPGGDLPGGGGTLSGTVSGASEYTGSCSANTSLHPDAVVDWTPTASGLVTINTCSPNTEFDTVLYVREGDVGGPELACNDDTVGCGVNSGHSSAARQGSEVELLVEAGTVYKIFVDGWTRNETTAASDFDLTVTPLSQCGDGVAEAGEVCDGADDGACPGLCQSDCTCEAPPPPVCGNGLLESGELCDGGDDDACPGLCQSDCACGVPPTEGMPGDGGIVLGQVAGASEHTGACSPNSALHPEAVVEWIPTSSGTVSINTCSPDTDFDTVLYVREGGIGGPELACNDDTAGCGVSSGHRKAYRQGSQVEITVQAGTVYEIFVDGWTSSATTAPGIFDLEVTPLP